jgi:hypothetical protein
LRSDRADIRPEAEWHALRWVREYGRLPPETLTGLDDEITPRELMSGLEAAGWSTSFRVVFFRNNQTWVGRAEKDGEAVEGQGASAREAWRATYAAAGAPSAPPA